MFLPRACVVLNMLLLSAASIYSQINCVPVFITEYNSVGHLQPQDIKQLDDANYLLAGKGSVSAAATTHGMLVKVSGTGDVLWSNILSSGTGSVFYGIVLLANGDYLLYGVMNSDTYPDGKPVITRVSSGGAVIWSRQVMVNEPGKDRIKDLKELNSGDFVGIMNLNDSSSQSDAVVFRMSATGNMMWSQAFDNGADDGFLTLAVDNNIVYAGGYYTSGFKKGVIARLNESGTILSSINIASRNNIDEYVTGLEVKSGLISYGLRQSNYSVVENIVLIQETMNGKKVFSRLAALLSETEYTKIVRTADQGFMILCHYSSAASNAVIKINRYGAVQWSTSLGPYYIKNQSFAMDITADEGSIAASYFTSGMSDINKMRIVKTDQYGYAGSCGSIGNGLFFDTATVSEHVFSWATQSGNTLQSLSNNTDFTSIVINKEEQCVESVCVDATPLPQGCGKTYRIEYNSAKNLFLRDVITSSDGGKVGVGHIGENNGVLIKFNTNGDVAWAKSYEEFFHNSTFMRVLRSEDNNLFVFANNDFIVNHYISTAVTVIKMNNNGDVLWSKNIMYYYDSQILDAISTPDNGFVMMLTDDYGSGHTYAQLIRFDAAGAIIWKKDLKYSMGAPLYKSLSCNTQYIYAAHDSYFSTAQERFGVDKFSMQTGEKIWSRRYVVDDDKPVLINRIFNINDTAYVFLNHFAPVNALNSTYNTVMLKLDPGGNIDQSFTVSANPVKLPQTWYIWDEAPPTVTITPDFDFVMAHKVYDGNTDGFNISRFLRDGTQVWSRNYNDLSKYSPNNIHPQGNGFIIVGARETGKPHFNQPFLLKVDSAGLIESGAQCMPVDAVISRFNTKINPTDVLIENVTDADLEIWDSEILSQPESVDATQYCHEIGNCGNVGFLQKGKGCSLEDTLIYYLKGPQLCDAAATWQYDPSFFKPLSVDAYSLQLVPLKKGTSTIKATIEGNCTITEKKITASVLLSASEMSLGNDTVICNGQHIRLSAGTGYASYAWNDDNNSSDSVLTVSSPGIYAVTVTDNCGSSKTDSVTVTDATAAFHLSGDTIRCNNETIVLTATAGLSNYQWFPQSNIQVNGNSASVSPDIITTYVVKAKSNAGCMVSDSVKVIPVRTPRVVLGNDTALCKGDTYLLDAGNGFDTYLWNKGQTANTITVNEQGAYWVEAVKDGCAVYDTLRITEIKPLPAFTLGNDTTICENAALSYTFTLLQASYNWSNGSTAGTNLLYGAGSYWLKVTQRGCSAYDTINVATRPAPVVFLGNDTVLCEGESKLLSPGNAGSYVWQNGSTSSDYLVTDAGNYFVTITEQGCSTRDSVRIDYRYKPFFTLGNDTFLCKGMEMTLSPEVNDVNASYNWQDHSTQSYYTIIREGIYALTVSNECGSYSDSVLVVPGICTLMIPNAFTPDNDGLNDVFRVKYVFPVKQFVFTIFNRWGQKVFETNDMTRGWDGRYKGNPEPSGVFVWKITVQHETGNLQHASGIVTLIR